MPRIVSAQVTRSNGSTFDAKIANLTPASLFLITQEPLLFRERVLVSLLGVEVDGEVAFAVAEPRLGGVIVFNATRPARETLMQHLDEVEVYAVAIGGAGEAVEEWLDPTTSGGTAKVRLDHTAKIEDLTPLAFPVVELGVPVKQAIDLETVHEMPVIGARLGEASRPAATSQSWPIVDPDTLVPIDDAERAPAKKNPPDYADTPTPQNMPVIGAPDLYKRPPLVVKGKKTKPADPVPTPAPRAMTPPPPAARTPSKPRIPKREDPTLPDLPPDEAARLHASIKAEPVRALSTLQMPVVQVELPVLEPDGMTIAFTTLAHFRAHYESTMMHGGIIARAGPHIVGQQRSLILSIVQIEERYSLVGRVAFNGKDGSVGFMIESFLSHRPYLEALSQRTEFVLR